MNKIKLAVIGTGGLAQNQHIPNICMSRNAELKTMCDLRKEVLDELGGYYGVKNLETDYKRVLADPEIEGVVIVTREDSHVPLTLEALEAGKHVYVEKPLAETAEECRKVVELQEKAGKRVFVGMNRRLAPAYLYAHDLLWKNGGPHNMFYRIADSYSLDWGKNYGPGQRVVHEVCHIFDILRYFAQSEVKSISCLKARNDDEQFALQFESGTIATILSSGYVTSDMPKEHFEAIADKGSVTVEDFAEARRYTFEDGEDIKKFAGHVHPKCDMTHALLMKEMGADAMHAVRRTSWKCAKRYNEMTERGETDSSEYKMLETFVSKHMPLRNYFMDKGWKGAIEHFADCIADSGLKQKAATADDALRAAQVTEAAIKSRETGAPVSL